MGLLPLLASGVTLRDCNDAILGILVCSVGQFPLLYRLRLFVSTWSNGPLVAIYPLVLLYLFQKDRLQNAGIPFWSLLFWLCLDFAGANAGSMFRHQIKPVLVPLSLIAGIAVGSFMQSFGRFSPRWLLWTYLSVVIVLFPVNSVVVGIARNLCPNPIPSDDIRKDITFRRVADYVRSHTDPADFIYIWARNSHAILWYAERRSPSRYYNSLFRCMPDFEATTIAAINARRPKLILISDGPDEFAPPRWLPHLLARDYAPACRIDDYQVFRRISGF